MTSASRTPTRPRGRVGAAVARVGTLTLRRRRRGRRRSRPAGSAPRRPERALSWAAVRAPTIGAVTPGRSRTQTSATSSGVQPRPSAARATASTMPRGALAEVAARRSSRSAATRARESDGVPVRYLPVSTPRPSGDHGQHAQPERGRGGEHLVLDVAVEQGVLHLGRGQRRPARHGPLPGGCLGGLPAGVVRDADVRRPPGRRRRGRARTASPRAGCRRPRCAPARGRRGRPRAARARRRGCGAGGRGRRRSRASPRAPGDAGLGGDHDLVAGDHVADQACAISSSDAPSPYPAAVSTRVPPASAKAISWSRASCSSVSRPQVSVPRPSRETFRPVGPRRAAAWAATVAAGGRRQQLRRLPPCGTSSRPSSSASSRA